MRKGRLVMFITCNSKFLVIKAALKFRYYVKEINHLKSQTLKSQNKYMLLEAKTGLSLRTHQGGGSYQNGS